MEPIRSLVLKEVKTDSIRSSLVGSVDAEGDLLLEGYDIGPGVKAWWGDSDYEYILRVKGKFKDTVLLHLIKDSFETDAAFREWLDSKGIPSEFQSWV